MGERQQIRRQAFVDQEWIAHGGGPAFSQARQASIPSTGSDGYERYMSNRLLPVRTSARTVSAGMRVPLTTGTPPRIALPLTTAAKVDPCVAMSNPRKRLRNMASTGLVCNGRIGAVRRYALENWRAEADDDEHYVYAVAL
jgi:hypothetical protein